MNNLTFRNKAGLSAGFDKNGSALRLWDAIGFSHAEIGTVTPLPQPGNTKPRVFRLKKDKALINRLGFNNLGADAVKKNISAARKYLSSDFIIGVNIGKNKDTSIEDAVIDYKICFEKLYDVADYFTLNISSPNTEGLRTLQEDDKLSKLLGEIQDLNRELSDKKKAAMKTVLLKISPDIDKLSADSLYRNVIRHSIDGIIATNTTLSRPDMKSNSDEQGGLSGKPLKPLSDEILKLFDEMKKDSTGIKPVLIGCGGIMSSDDMKDKIKYGASLIQIYTGLIYEGPSLLKKILN
ncbi:MAG: quinone-dependent dihydroorotate dehydrogenase [Ignavibacteria bacterium]|nr:quinone-dependent dihydroorotate dehydrogenase [Ignavibacteria bacterium]